VRVSASDIASWVSALAAAGAFSAAAYQLSQTRRDALDQRAAEIASVSLDTNVVHRPVKADEMGQSRWDYRFIVGNPGRLPISAVELVIKFTTPVSRMHHDRSLEPETYQLDMYVPVIPAGQEKSWNRTVLLLDHDRHEDLRNTVAEVTFSTPDAGRITTTWPNGNPSVRNKRLYHRLKDLRVQ
jgi:hypothetical protein